MNSYVDKILKCMVKGNEIYVKWFWPSSTLFENRISTLVENDTKDKDKTPPSFVFIWYHATTCIDKWKKTMSPYLANKGRFWFLLLLPWRFLLRVYQKEAIGLAKNLWKCPWFWDYGYVSCLSHASLLLSNLFSIK